MTTTYMPRNFEWTDEEKETVLDWVGKDVYVDLGDSIIDGGELYGVLTHADAVGVRISDGVRIPFDHIIHIELEG